MDSESSILNEFNTLLSSSEVIFIVFYRGHWCPFCMSYLTTLTSMSPSLIAANTTPLIITSESAEHLPATRKSSGYTGKVIVDPENILAMEFKRRGWVDVAISEKKGYPHGMAQPAILALKKNGEVLEKWAIVPTLMNMGGAKDRPELEQVWENVQATLKGQERIHNVYSLQGALGVLFKKLFR